ncbi:MAG: hypothetical protein KZQ70_10690 [gamma proteobacterium symbiont of Lucinoma myriamae]|nr:hypothetical protein [gamma proteobacterium symbiont of Lucinoma myriamae]
MAIRELTDSVEGKLWLQSVNEKELCSIEAVYVSLVNLKNKLDKNKDKTTEINCLIKQLSNSYRFLNLAMGLPVRQPTVNKFVKRAVNFRNSLGTRGFSSLNPYEYCQVKVMGDPDDDTEHPEIYSIKQTLKDESERQELAELGVEPEEADKSYEFIFVRHQAIPAFAQAFNDALRARGAAKRIELQNQYLPQSTQLLNDHDLYKLYELLRFLNTDTYNSENLLLALFIRCVFETSSNVDRTRSLQIVKWGGIPV